MSHKDMITSVISIKTAKSIDDAPNYGEDFKMVRAESVIVVPGGTVEGNPTVDIQLSDADGNKYLIMATGKIIETIGQVVNASRRQTNTH